MALYFGRTDEHGMLADTLRRFAAAESDFEARMHRLKSDPPDRLALWSGLADLGVLAALVPESAGGFGGGPADMAVVQEALAPALLIEPILTAGVVCGRLLEAANETGLLNDIVAGAIVPTLAYGDGFDPWAAPRTTATVTADGVRLHGSKSAVRHADVASHILVGAVLDATPALFMVPRSAAGLSISTMRMIDGAGAADLSIDNVLLAADARLSIDDVHAAVEDALEWGLAGLGVETAALAAAANAATFDYLNTRKQFGSPLAAFQALQHKAADMAIAGEEAAAMASLAILMLDEPANPARSAAILRASLSCDAAGRLVGHTAIQLFGGMGVSDELVVSHYARRLAAIRTQWGSVDVRSARLSDLEGNR